MASSSSSFHDVFISFRGLDTRRGFLSHLVKELRQEQIKIYVDENLNRGDEISSSLFEAIEESKISLIIFSQNYASSRWCLDELKKIIECMKKNQQVVLPVFLNIDPSDVRHQRGTCANAFAEHELTFQEVMVQSWRSSLKKAADLSGYDSSKYNNEAELIEDIVKGILEKLDQIYPSESTGLVGIDRNLACIESLLEMEARSVKFIGIWGMPGIGKTTIAQAVFDKFSSRFEGCCFLQNVREESIDKRGLDCLRNKLRSELFEGKSARHRERLSWKKVLVVLDDVSTPKQLSHLVREGIRFGIGSRVIITTHNKHVLTSGGVHAIHEVKELNFEESLKLFSLKAFSKCIPENGYEQLSKKAIAYAKGVPLALEVLGSSLHSKSVEVWESTLRKFKRYPNGQIQNVLKVSYDELEYEEKDIFLDVAFFFKGEHKDHVMKLLDATYFSAASGIDSLLDKALILSQMAAQYKCMT